MKKYLILVYSHTGNNRFLANKLSEQLSCDLKEIQPRNNGHSWLMFCSWLGINVRQNISTKDLQNYDEIILFGPIWMGSLIAPLRSVLKICLKASKTVHFGTCCGTSDADKDTGFGYAKLLEKVKKEGGDLIQLTQAFPIPLILTEEEAQDSQAVTNARLSEANFKGEIKKRFDQFVQDIRANETVNS